MEWRFLWPYYEPTLFYAYIKSQYWLAYMNATTVSIGLIKVQFAFEYCIKW